MRPPRNVRCSGRVDGLATARACRAWRGSLPAPDTACRRPARAGWGRDHSPRMRPFQASPRVAACNPPPPVPAAALKPPRSAGSAAPHAARGRGRLRAGRRRRAGGANRAGGAAPLRPARGGAGPALRHAHAAGRTRASSPSRPRSTCRRWPPALCTWSTSRCPAPGRQEAPVLHALRRDRDVDVVFERRRSERGALGCQPISLANRSARATRCHTGFAAAETASRTCPT